MCEVLGGWFDLGFNNWYSTRKPLNSLADLKDMKIRSPGGVLNSFRIRYFGGIPNVTAWPDVPLAMSQGTFDGLISTNESTNSAKLYDSGMRHSLQDHQGMGLYVPLVNQAFWDKLGPKLQETMLQAVEPTTCRPGATTPPRRRSTAARTSTQQGVTFVDVPQAELDAAHAKMVAEQDKAVARRAYFAGAGRSWSWRMSASDAARRASGRARASRCFAVWDRIERTLVGLLGAVALLIAVVQVFGRYIDPAERDHLGRGGHRLHRRLGGDDHRQPVGAHRRAGAPGPGAAPAAGPACSAGSRCSTAWWRSPSPSAWSGTAGRWSSTALLLDQRSSSDLQFPMWIYYAALPAGGALMLVRYVIRLIRYAFFFDPRTMSVGHTILAHEAPPELTLTLTEQITE